MIAPDGLPAVDLEDLAGRSSLRILVLSDTHGSLGFFKKAIEALSPLDLVLHLGDHSAPYGSIAALSPSPVLAVAGNCDGEYSRNMADSLRLNLAGHPVFMTHGHRLRVKQTLESLLAAAAEPPVEADLILFGHTHHYLDREQTSSKGRPFRLLNPGSASQSFFNPNPSCALVLLEPGSIQVFRHSSISL